MPALFGGFMDYHEGQYGVALLSHFPIEEVTNTGCPTDRSHAPPSPRGSASAMTARKSCSSVFIYIEAPRSAWPKCRES